MKKFQEFSNEAFKPKNVKGRQVDTFIKNAKNSVDEIQDVLMNLHIENLDQSDIEKLKKGVDSLPTNNSAEVGLVAMLKHYFNNYDKEFVEKGGLMSLNSFKNAVEKATGYKFKTRKVSYDSAVEEFAMLGMYEDEDFYANFGYKPEECAYYILDRNTENRNELCYIDATVTPIDVHMSYYSDKVSSSTDKGVPYKQITSHIKQVWG